LAEAKTADSHCSWCPWFSNGATDLTVACPGHQAPTGDDWLDNLPDVTAARAAQIRQETEA
jgi:hypothetical protein